VCVCVYVGFPIEFITVIAELIKLSLWNFSVTEGYTYVHKIMISCNIFHRGNYETFLILLWNLRYLKSVSVELCTALHYCPVVNLHLSNIHVRMDNFKGGNASQFALISVTNDWSSIPRRRTDSSLFLHTQTISRSYLISYPKDTGIRSLLSWRQSGRNVKITTTSIEIWGYESVELYLHYLYIFMVSVYVQG